MQAVGRSILLTVAAVAVLTLGMQAAKAGSPLGIGVAEPSFDTGGIFGGLLVWINYWQQAFYRALTEAIEAMRADPWQMSGLVWLSFAYGVFHAAGPGHGKAVISSYLIANEAALRRGVLLAFLASLLQGIVAIVVVGIAFFILRGTGVTLTDATWAMQTASFALVSCFGAWLLWKKLAGLRRPSATGIAYSTVAAFGEASGKGRATSALLCEDAERAIRRHAVHDRQTCAACGHVHMPAPAMLSGRRLSVSQAGSAVLAVGLRPCSGALIVLTFAVLNGLYLGGALSVFAMSIGTAITVSGLATLAVSAKGAAVRLIGRGKADIQIGRSIEVLGAGLVLLLGLLLLGGSFAG